MRRLAIALLACELVSGLRLLVPAGPRVGARAGDVRMKATPRVPYKAPGMDSPQWIDVYNRMYRERIMFLGQDITDDFANTMIAVLLYLESEDATSPVAMYFNVAGGMTKAGLAMHDTMRIMPYDIQTVNMGMSAQVAAFLVAGGTKGKRFALPNARFLMQNPRIDPPVDDEGNPIRIPMQATEMQLEVQECLRDKKRVLEGFSRFTGRSVELLQQDFKRDFWLTAREATQYGLVDQLLLPKRADKALSQDIQFGQFGTEQRFQGQAFAGPSTDASGGAPPPSAA